MAEHRTLGQPHVFGDGLGSDGLHPALLCQCQHGEYDFLLAVSSGTADGRMGGGFDNRGHDGMDVQWQ